MSSVDHETVLIERIWDALEAHAPFTAAVKAGNRVKLCGAKPMPLKTTWSQAPADFPEVTISAATIADTLFTQGESYAMRPGASFNPVTNGVSCTLTFGMLIEIVHRDTNFVNARQLNAEIMTALRKSGPSLGVTAFRVQRVGPSGRTNRVMTGRFGNLGDASGMPRIVTSISLPVTIIDQTSNLLT